MLIGAFLGELEFPPVDLLPQDGQLIVTFMNPYNLYRHTPALRALHNQNVTYKINNKVRNRSTEAPYK